LHHGAGLRKVLQREGWPDDAIDAHLQVFLNDYRQADLPAADVAMLDYVHKVTVTPAAVQEEDVNVLREAGFDDLAIHDICAIAAYFAFVNRLADGLGVETEERFAGQAYYQAGRES